MLDYNGYLQTVIAHDVYTLTEMEERIDRVWLDGNITVKQRDSLRTLAAENADDAAQIDVSSAIADLQARVYALEHPTDIYPVWTAGYVTQQHEIVRYDVSGDGELDLCQYNGGRTSTALSIGKIEGWQMLSIELVPTHTITRDASGGYVLTPIEGGEE